MKPKFDSEDPLFNNLDAFRSIDIDGDWKNVRKNMGFDSKRALKKKSMARTWWAAASVVLVIGIGFLSQQYFFAPQEMIIAMAGDDQKEVLLPDGSTVTLNKQAELSYPEKFRHRKRELILSGEAFFEVERNPKKPFMVSIEDRAMVKVLGTSFNIWSNPKSDVINVMVVEGSVAFSDASKKSSALILKKDEQATLTDGILRKEETVNLNILSWKTGILYFDQSILGDVVKKLENHYNREILIEEDIPADLKFTSTIDNQELESVLEELSLVLGLETSYEDDLILISKLP